MDTSEANEWFYIPGPEIPESNIYSYPSNFTLSPKSPPYFPIIISLLLYEPHQKITAKAQHLIWKSSSQIQEYWQSDSIIVDVYWNPSEDGQTWNNLS